MPESRRDVKKAVLDAVDELAPRLVRSVSDAIKIPSVNPKYPGQDYDKIVGAESDVSALIADLYREAGAETELVAEEARRDNACGRVRGAGGGRSLVLNGHVDVVPAIQPNLWDAPPFSGQITDTAVLGRGATDMKGGTVAAAYAALALARAGITLKGDLVLHAVVGEEVGDHNAGTSAVLGAGYTGDAMLLCEPTNPTDGLPSLVTSTPGLLWFSMTITGKTAHPGWRGSSIHPTLDGERLGVNTVDKYWVIYHALRELENTWALRDRHPLFAPGHFSLLPGVLKANPKGIDVPFLLADTLTVDYCVLHHPDRGNDEVRAEIEETVRLACAADTWLREHRPEFEWKLDWPPYNTPAGHGLEASVSNAHVDALGGVEYAAPPKREGFFGVCDITWSAAQGIDGVIYGPGAAKTAHAENEYVPIHQLITATKTYALTALDFCGIADDRHA
ncbi:ArgE/DapE family deacylase [Rhizohabitans arisaemae]|uniref:ArgE/DapE family deacylase n=1 Tax=Rhizohabitans arisaemae TaxID=2720610 RepID=UPI0024B2542F|nr:ArgE/DapE family deacylase [Rhizohabitans arisaemae]